MGILDYLNPFWEQYQTPGINPNATVTGTSSKLPNLFMTPNLAEAGLLGTDSEQAQSIQNALQNQATKAGLLSAGISFLTQPRNLQAGSALPYLGRAYQQGMASAGDIYGTGLNQLARQQAFGQKQKYQTIDVGDKIILADPVTGETIKEMPKGLEPKAPTPTIDVQNLLAMPEVRKDKFGFNLLKTDPKAGIDYFTSKFEKKQPGLNELYQKTEVVTEDGQTVFKPTLEGVRLGLKPLNAVTGKPIEGPIKYAPTKTPTSEQAKSATYYGQMNSASKVYNDLVEKGFDPSAVTSQIGVEVAGGPFRYFAGADSQKARQAQEQWAEAFLRVKTGATATKDEIEANINTFFPRIGETDPTVIEQKRQARKQAELDVAKMTQPGTVQIEEEKPAPKPKSEQKTKNYYIGNRQIVPNANNTGWIFADTGEAVPQ